MSFHKAAAAERRSLRCSVFSLQPMPLPSDGTSPSARPCAANDAPPMTLCQGSATGHASPPPMKQTSRDLVHRLAYSWTGWPQSEPLPSEPGAELLAVLDEAWSRDGLHRISHRWQPDIVQFTFEAGPDIAPQTIAARAKGRLDHTLRAHGWRAGLARKVALRSLEENTLETVLHYIATQLDRADLADPRYVQSLAGAARCRRPVTPPMALCHRSATGRVPVCIPSP